MQRSETGSELLRMREALHKLEAHPDWLYCQATAAQMPPLGEWELNTAKGVNGKIPKEHYTVFFLRRLRVLS